MQHRAKAEKAQLFLQALGLEFAADFHQDLFVFPPVKRASRIGKTNLVGLFGDRVHLDLLPVGIEPRMVAHFAEVEIAPEQAIDIAKYIEDEFGGDAATIVVSGF